MRLTTKGRFAVTAMIDLALRENTGPSPWRPQCPPANLAVLP